MSGQASCLHLNSRDGCSHLIKFPFLRVCEIALISLIVYEGQRLTMQMLWLPLVGTLTVGVSLGLPLFLLLRELHLEAEVTA
ncbi:DUF2834 domain-containing protein [Leptolyngbya iicbica]|uniref:DUF2834 domain-containing protein n=1 Tax=Leptolyngbya iicbica TaxID=3161580 RepID=UPI0026865053